MSAVYLIGFIAGLLLAVRIMFFGAERRHVRSADTLLLRRSEPAVAAFLVMFGLVGYACTRPGRLSPAAGVGAALVLGTLWAAVVTRLAIATARMRPEHDPDDPRFVLQGHVAVVTTTIPPAGQGSIAYGETGAHRTLPACSIDGQAVEAGVEVCIERVDDGVALVERWALVEARL